MSKSNPLGPGTRNMATNVLVETSLAIESLARSSGVSASRYLRALAEFAVKHQLIATRNAEDEQARDVALRTRTAVPEVRVEIDAAKFFLLRGLQETKGNPHLNECPPESQTNPKDTTRHATTASFGKPGMRKLAVTLSPSTPKPGPVAKPSGVMPKAKIAHPAIQKMVDAERGKRADRG